MLEFLLMALSFMLGWNLHSFWMARRISRIMGMMQEAEEEAMQEADDKMIAVKLEKQGDTVLVYNKKTEAFIVQVKSKKEFVDYCHANYEGKIVFMTKADIEILESL